MVEKTRISVKKKKRLPKGQRTHNRRLKQALRKEQAMVVQPQK